MIDKLGNRNSRGAPKRRRGPSHFGKRGTLGKPLDQVRIRTIRTAERYQICQTLRDKAITALTVHLYVCDQGAFVERTEMLEHAIPGQLFEWSSGEVGGIAHEQQVRKVVGAQLPNCIFGDGQGFVVGLKCAAFVHRADLDSNPLSIDLSQDRLYYFEKETRAILQAPAVFVLTQVGGGVEELRDQIEIVGEDLDTIEAGSDRVSRSSREVRNRDLNLLLGQRPRCYRGLPSRSRDRYLAWIDLGCGHRLRAVS